MCIRDRHRADQYITTISSIKHEVLDANKRMESSAPTGTDMKAIKTTFFDLLYRIEEVDGKLYDIKSAFPAPSAASTTTTHATPPPPQADVRLPRLELPSFDGNLDDWMSFRDMFSTAVHNNATLSNAQKLTYLKSVLKGDAGRLIKTLTLTGTNYDIAWKQLKKRYQNERKLLFAIFKKLVEQPN